MLRLNLKPTILAKRVQGKYRPFDLSHAGKQEEAPR